MLFSENCLCLPQRAPAKLWRQAAANSGMCSADREINPEAEILLRAAYAVVYEALQHEASHCAKSTCPVAQAANCSGV